MKRNLLFTALAAVVLVLCTACPGPGPGPVGPDEPDTTRTVVYNPLTPESNIYVYLFNLANSCIGKSGAEVNAIFTAAGFEQDGDANRNVSFYIERDIPMPLEDGEEPGEMGEYSLNTNILYDQAGRACLLEVSVSAYGVADSVPSAAELKAFITALGASPVLATPEQINFALAFDPSSDAQMLDFNSFLSFVNSQDPTLFDDSHEGLSVVAFWLGRKLADLGMSAADFDMEELYEMAEQGRLGMFGINGSVMEETESGLSSVQTMLMVSGTTAK